MSLFEPELDHRFEAFFMLGYFPDLFSTRFQSISGLSRGIEIQPIREGGNNVSSRYIPRGVTFSNLTFERGVMTVSPLTAVFDFIMSGFHTKAISIDVEIMLLSERGLPMATWSASGVMPVKMSIGRFDATSGQVLINSLEIACQRVEWLGLKL